MQLLVASFLFSLYLPPKEATVPCDFVARKPPSPCDFGRKETTVPCGFAAKKEATVPCDFVARKKQKMQAPNVRTQKKRS